ncbi:MAG: S-formylglutathione hydrolase [Legionellaceae bacterium]|nr:S-formylglutathione hydrolase [Legionellaceae bacterium]
MSCRLIEKHQSFGGEQCVYAHWSEVTKSKMRFAIYLPPAVEKTSVPVLYWLSGLTCSEQNFITKAGAQRVASELGMAIVVPDTSPREINIPEYTQYDNLGEGAGFYVDATESPWREHYQMSTYISVELPRIISQNFPVDMMRCGIFGHSMGGHGALTIGLKNNQTFRSLSAFAPICAPTLTPWGSKVFSHYLGSDQHAWRDYDGCALIKALGWPHGEILIDQGSADPFLAEQLKPDLLMASCEQAGVNLNLRFHAHYGHNYYFVATFIDDHLRFHANNLSN